jgi:hypothetical protein
VISPEQFDQDIRSLTQREPFQPFVVELDDGSEILVEHPRVAFGGGAAVFIHPTTEALVQFTSITVKAMRLAAPETTR